MVERAQGFPATWAFATLGEVTTKPQYGWTTKATDAGNKLKLLRTSDISTGRVNWNTVPTCVNEPDDPRKFFLNAGDIVVARAGSVGKPFLIREDVTDAVFASYLVRFTPKILPEYINFFMQSRRYWEQIEDKSSGIAIPNVNASKLSQVEMAVAPLNEQRRIVDKVESLFAQLDHGEASLRYVQKLLARYRQSVLKAAVTGQLTAEWRAENADRLESGSDLLESILQARRANWQGRGKYKEPVAPDASDLPELPEGWVWISLGHLLQEFITGPFGSALHKSDYVDGGIPLVNPINIVDGRVVPDFRKTVSEDTLDRLGRYRLETSDVVIARRGDMGRCAAISDAQSGWLCGTGSMILRPISFANPDFLSATIRAHTVVSHLERNSVGTTMKNLNQRALLSAPIALPSPEEQAEAVRKIEETFSQIELMISHCQTELTRSAALRQSILKDAFSGKLVPQDPDDEPASELLARIRAERDATAPKKRTRKKATA